jgi:monoamine oxidase
VILEAAQRIGGRIHAVMDTAARPIADLGPTWVWPPYQPVVERWITKLKLTTFDQFNDGDAVIEGYGPEIQRQPLPGQHGMVRISGLVSL